MGCTKQHICQVHALTQVVSLNFMGIRLHQLPHHHLFQREQKPDQDVFPQCQEWHTLTVFGLPPRDRYSWRSFALYSCRH